MSNQLEIKNLNVSIAEKPILKDFSLVIPKGEVHALMGPNGTGKSTLAKVIAGHEDYEVESGEILVDGENIIGMEPDEIAHKGIFLAFQYPMEIPGVTIANFIRAALQSRLDEDQPLMHLDTTVPFTKRWTYSRSTENSLRARSMKAFLAVKRNAAKSFKWPC
jgi:Fe-S cluster assembly ATP-binding protein